MPTQSDLLEVYFDSKTLPGLIRSGWMLLLARRVQPRTGGRKHVLRPGDYADRLLYGALIAGPALILSGFQSLRTAITGKPRQFEDGAWQWALQFSLREDLAHHTVETTGYAADRPDTATETDDLTAWVVALTQFIWEYDDLMGVIWDEWTQIRLIAQVAEEADLSDHPLVARLVREWELARPYHAPLNGTYADIRREVLRAFLAPRLEMLPAEYRQKLDDRYNRLAHTRRARYQRQMSLLSRIEPGPMRDDKVMIPLWDACVGLVAGGEYHLLNLVLRDAQGRPLVFSTDGECWPLTIRDGQAFHPDGREMFARGADICFVEGGARAGALEPVAVSHIKWQIDQILRTRPDSSVMQRHEVDVLLAESPRRLQKRLRALLPSSTRDALEDLLHAPVIINWDMHPRDRTLAELRRAQRGTGNHALTVIRTDTSMVFDQHHVYFDGTWSLAMAEVLTNAASQWNKRITGITPRECTVPAALKIEATPTFLREARRHQQITEISAETTIFDITQIFNLRKLLSETGTHLTVNDLLVTT
ncbi:MAG: hypothetical protein IT326_00700, partial [Anaerolineae bacterium]|nr:hypothetical protein [Anaerolineae bacterium]